MNCFSSCPIQELSKSLQRNSLLQLQWNLFPSCSYTANDKSFSTNTYNFWVQTCNTIDLIKEEEKSLESHTAAISDAKSNPHDTADKDLAAANLSNESDQKAAPACLSLFFWLVSPMTLVDEDDNLFSEKITNVELLHHPTLATQNSTPNLVSEQDGCLRI